MIRYFKRFYFIKVYESWYTYKFKFWDIFTLNVFFHVKNKDKWIPGIREDSFTLELDLEQEVDEIFSKFSKQIRQQIKIAEREGTNCYFHQDLNQFVDFFNEFALKRHTWTTSKERLLEMGDNLKLSFAVYEGKILAAHSYLVDTELRIVRHLHSATTRLEDGYDKNLIGRANKYLTVNNILYFKNEGFKLFDFGGYAKNTDNGSLTGVNNFKLLFGGKLVKCENYYSFNYWLLKKLVQLLGLAGKV